MRCEYLPINWTCFATTDGGNLLESWNLSISVTCLIVFLLSDMINIFICLLMPPLITKLISHFFLLRTVCNVIVLSLSHRLCFVNGANYTTTWRGRPSLDRLDWPLPRRHWLQWLLAVPIVLDIIVIRKHPVLSHWYSRWCNIAHKFKCLDA